MIDPPTRVMLLMLCKVHEQLGIRGPVDAVLLRAALEAGQDWYVEDLKVGAKPVTKQVNREVLDILNMWSVIEWSFGELSPDDKGRFRRAPTFLGFDRSTEDPHWRTARFYVHKLKRFETFEGRNLTAYGPTLDRHRRMLKVYDPIRPEITQGPLKANRLGQILNAGRPPMLSWTERARRISGPEAPLGSDEFDFSIR